MVVPRLGGRGPLDLSRRVCNPPPGQPEAGFFVRPRSGWPGHFDPPLDMEPPFDLPGDLDTPVSAFRKLEPLQPRFLLESVVGAERESRYSFLGFGPIRSFVLEQDAFLVDGAPKPFPRNRSELFACLREALAKAPQLSPNATGIPFSGGLVGATSYELVSLLEGMPLRRRDPDTPLFSLLAPSALLVFDHSTRRIGLFVDGDARDRQSLRREVLGLLGGPLPPAAKGGGFSAPSASLPRGEFEAAVRLAQEEVRNGEVYQLVLSSAFEGECDLDPLSVYRALRLLNPSPYMFLIRLGKATLVGSSPEALVRLEGRRAELRPIAGTRPRGSDAESDRALAQELLRDQKESAEHVMLVDLARNDLGRVAIPGSVKVTPYRDIERYSHVMHIVSGVKGLLDAERDAFDLFAAALPAGTVTGAPKVRAMELIDALEPVGRGFYAGAAGFFGHGGTTEQALTIRSLVFGEGRYRYQAGAGIVADSDPAREHREVLAKASAMRAALNLATEELSRCAS